MKLTQAVSLPNNVPVARRAQRPVGRPRKRETKLSRWLDQAGVSREQAAGELGVTRQYLDRVCRGVNRPSLPLAVKIEKFTRGAVPVEEWVTGRPQRSGSE
jgi:transcriptional regulator with XRE-family HTH domain